MEDNTHAIEIRLTVALTEEFSLSTYPYDLIPRITLYSQREDLNAFHPHINDDLLLQQAYVLPRL